MNSDGDIRKRMRVFFSGRVQGVGFRFTVYRIVEAFEVTGYVRNLPDGNVEVLAEGVEQELVDFLNSIRTAQIGRYIANERIDWMPATNQYEGFRISF